jgi:hypothetical protein
MTEYNCNICNKKYASYKTYWTHNKKFHNNNNINNNIKNNDNINDNINNDINNNINDNINNNINDNNEIRKYKCKYCNKGFKNNSNRCEHQKKVCEKKNQNNNQEILNNNSEIKKYKCKYCNKGFNHSSNMYEHQRKVCKINENNNIINNINTTNNNSNNNTTYNTNSNNTTNNNNNITNIIINPVGNEDINDLTDLEVKNILTNIYDSVHKLIETLNFNERLPSNHSFCSTALNSPYISVYDTKTNKINKERKTYLFRKLIDNSIMKIQQIFNNNKKKIKEKQRKLIEKELDEYVSIHNIITNEKYKKSILSNINLTSYNKKNIILKTWDEIKNNPIFNQTIKEKTFEEEMNEFFIKERDEYLNSLSDSDSSTDNINKGD